MTELLAGPLGLGHQHGKAAGVGDPQLLRLEDQGRPGGVIDDVQHPLAVGELPEVHRCGPVAGVHAHRGGVGDDPGVGVAVQVIVVVGAAAGDDGDAGPQLFQGGLYRDGSAAAAQHQGLFPGGVNAAAADHVEKAVKVCVVAVEGAVRAADDGVDALQLGCRFRQLRAVRHHRLFIWDGDVETVPGPGLQKEVQFLSGDLKEPVVVTGQFVMDHGGVAVAQRFSQQTAVQHQITSL